jgi:hypothetical protein
MIPKASRKFRANMTAAASGESIVAYTVSSNRTLVITDLAFSYSDQGAGITIYDSIVATAAQTAAQTMMRFYGNPVVITDIQNGGEFSLGVCVAMDDPNHGLPTYAFFVGGYER